jgi:hypothetical protein
MSRALWAVFYAVGLFGVAFWAWRGLISLADTVEHLTRRRDKR